MRTFLVAAASSLALAACGLQGKDNETAQDDTGAQASSNDYGYDTYSGDNLADTMASNDDAAGKGDAMAGADDAIPDPEDRPIMQAQVVLDREGFGPGVIDGKMGMSTENALNGFQTANNLEVTGELDEATKQALAEWEQIPATRVVTVPPNWGSPTYYKTPDDAEDQAKMQRLGYSSLDEKLAERFHTTVDVLKQLNPNGRPAGMKGPASASPSPTPSATASGSPSPTPSASGTGFTPQPGPKSYFQAGQQLRVPNIGGDRIAPGAVKDLSWQQTLATLGVGSEQPEVDRIVVSKAGKTLKAYQGDTLVALFTVSSGSSEFPLPLGEWDIVGIAHNPTYAYSPEVLTGGQKSGESYDLPPGPNGPVGVVWIDLSKEHYGIHGTPDPSTIGRAQSHGCVRLTNWDAARLAQMVSQSTQVIFEA
ncbi:murein L,D-transpeptidase [Erythrobacter litoralis]|uniref:L,D-transpeptidase family protein n=1 Tax=Erythrobacter litoralis TaxID=39960 RepID=UPI002435D86D|nr:L,D-transpeptidase family protein [Erythrobacter litoralis]MDG6079682.1 murein L,D-transpeptidase [Erythrobacter litoralis]